MEYESKWYNFFKKALSNNSQLQFANKISLSLTDTDNMPYSEIVDINSIDYAYTDNKGINNAALVIFLDNRTHCFKLLLANTYGYISLYFPLTREKFKMLVINKVLFEDFKGKIDNDFINNVSNIDSELVKKEILNSYWKKLTNEDKLNYEVIQPETVKINDNLLNNDINKFEAQEEIFHSANFSVVFLFPVEVDYTIYPMPQVVANNRKPNFESIYKPRKTQKRYMFKLDWEEITWKFSELNP